MTVRLYVKKGRSYTERSFSLFKTYNELFFDIIDNDGIGECQKDYL